MDQSLHCMPVCLEKPRFALISWQARTRCAVNSPVDASAMFASSSACAAAQLTWRRLVGPLASGQTARRQRLQQSASILGSHHRVSDREGIVYHVEPRSRSANRTAAHVSSGYIVSGKRTAVWLDLVANSTLDFDEKKHIYDRCPFQRL
jgi:hypothetical protein